jgi:hypothetical protein
MGKNFYSSIDRNACHLVVSSDLRGIGSRNFNGSDYKTDELMRSLGCFQMEASQIFATRSYENIAVAMNS